jgi:hypothetical protein
MFTPLSPFFAVLISPYDLLSLYFPSSLVVNLARTVFSAVGAWMIYIVYRSVRGSLHGRI